MDLASIRIITNDVDRLAHFYEVVTGVAATRPAPVFAELRTTSGTLAIASTATVAMLGDDAPKPASNHSIIIEFLVTDVDAEFTRLRARRRRASADNHAVGQQVNPLPRSRRKPRQPLLTPYPVTAQPISRVR